jgi:hypothetical protein
MLDHKGAPQREIEEHQVCELTAAEIQTAVEAGR